MAVIHNPTSSSGSGFNLEHYVQATYLASLILGTPVPRHQNLIVSCLKFQSRITAQTDDLVVDFSRGTSSEKRFIQSKKGFSVNSNKTFNEVILAAWKDYINPIIFDPSTDCFFITTDFISETDSDNVLVMLDWAKFSSDSRDFFLKVDNNKSKAAKLKYFTQALELAKGSAPSKDEIFGFLKSFYIQGYDYLSAASKDKETLKWFLTPYLKEGISSDLALSKLLSYIFECNQNAATLTIDTVGSEIKELFNLTASTKINDELFGLLKKSKSSLEHSIFNDIKGFHIDRTAIVDALIADISKQNLILLEGDAGVGKSAVIKDAIHKLYGQDYGFIFLKADLLDRDTLAETLSDIGISGDFDSLVSRWILLPNLVIVVDSLEKLFESDKKGAFLELIGTVLKYNRIKIITTCRKYAVNSLLSKYRMERFTYSVMQIPDISDNEIEMVVTKFPKLKPLMDRPKLKVILKKPFYLNMAVQMTENRTEDSIDETTFKEALWKFAVEKHGDTAAGGSALRATAFLSIVLKRAKDKMPYVKPDIDLRPEVIQVLEQDGILIKQENGDSYAPAHDVLEDLAITRHINSLYNSKANNQEFIEGLELYPALRRGMRLWINEEMGRAKNDISQFVTEILGSKQSSQFIKDEILLAILNSEKCYQFLDENSSVFISDSFKQLERVILMLNVAFIEKYNGDQHLRSIKTFGPGWNAVIRFIDKYYSQFPPNYDEQLLLILDKASLQFEPEDKLPDDTEIITRHSLRIFKSSLYKTQRDRALIILCRVIEFAMDEIAVIFETTINRIKGSVEESHGHLNSDTVKEILVEPYKYVKIYKYFPDQVITIAKELWLYQKKFEPHQYHGSSLENSWGLVDYPYKYFNASAYQTPFRYLIKFHPTLAIKFFIDVTNTCVTSYSGSEYASQNGTKWLEFSLIDGTRIKQISDSTLWDLPRKFYGGSPDLLASLHMALEEYLFSCIDGGIDIVPFSSILLKECKSISATAVLVSAILKDPFSLGEEVISFLKVREIFKWDLERYGQERMNKNPSGLGNELYYVQERKLSNTLPFRKNNLEQIAFILQVNGISLVNSIIDTHKLNADPNDTSWLLALRRMDLRNTVIKEHIEEKKVEFIPKPLPEELGSVVDNAAKEQESFGLSMEVFLWGEKVLSNELVSDLNYETWKKHYHTLSSQRTTPMVPGIDPIMKLAAVGLSMFAGNLTGEEKQFCVSNIRTLLQKICENVKEGSAFSMFNGFEKSCYQAFPVLLTKELTSIVSDSGKIKKEILELVLLLEVESKLILLQGIREKLWYIDSTLAENCLIVLYNLTQKGHPKFEEKESETAEGDIYSNILEEYSKSNGEFKFEFSASESRSASYSLQILTMIPNDLLNSKYFTLFKDIINAAINLPTTKQVDRFEFLSKLSTFLADYLIKNIEANAREILLILLQSIDKNSSLIFDTLKLFVRIGYNSKAHTSILFHFETILWFIFKKEPRIGLINCLLFESLPSPSDLNKLPEIKELHNIHHCLVEQCGKEENVIMPIFKLLSGVGAIYQPISLQWLKNGVPLEKLQAVLKQKDLDFVEEYISQMYNNHLEYLHKNKELKEYYTEVLNSLIDCGSSKAFRIRDELI